MKYQFRTTTLNICFFPQLEFISLDIIIKRRRVHESIILQKDLDLINEEFDIQGNYVYYKKCKIAEFKKIE